MESWFLLFIVVNCLLIINERGRLDGQYRRSVSARFRRQSKGDNLPSPFSYLLFHRCDDDVTRLGFSLVRLVVSQDGWVTASIYSSNLHFQLP